MYLTAAAMRHRGADFISIFPFMPAKGLWGMERDVRRRRCTARIVPGPAAEQGRDCHVRINVLRCAHAMYHYIAFCAGFQAGFLLSRVWQQIGLNAAAGLCLPPANLRRQLHIGNGMGLGTEAESPNVRWGSGGKDGSLR